MLKSQSLSGLMARRKGNGALGSLYSYRPRMHFIRVGILIVLLASFMVTLLYIDFTDEGLDGGGGGRQVVEEQGDGDAGREEGEGEGGEDEDSDEGEGEEEAEGERGGGLGSHGQPQQDEAGGGRTPEVLTIQPFHGPARGGLEITIHGHHFMGYGEWSTTALINDRRCSSTDVLNYETAICTLPPGVGGALNARITKTVGGKLLVSNANTLFSYDSPLVERVAPTHSPTGGGVTITVFGTNFGPAELDEDGRLSIPTVLLGESECKDVVLKSDNELTCTAPPGPGGPTTIQVVVGSGVSRVESHRSRGHFAYLLSPKEKIHQESKMLLDGLTVKHDTLPVFAHKKGLSGLNELIHKDLFSGRTISSSITPDVLELLPEHDLQAVHGKCAVVFNSLQLLETSYGADIDAADAVFRFNNAPTEDFRSEVGQHTTYRFVQTPLVRSVLQKNDPDAARRAWKPTPGEKLIMASDLAQDLFVMLHNVWPRSELLLPSSAILGNIFTMYVELRRRFVDLGLETEAQEEEDNTVRLRALLGGSVTMARLAKLAAQQNELSEIEPLLGAMRPSPPIVATLLTIQMCGTIDLYGYDSVFASGRGGGSGLSYYSSSPVGLEAYDIWTGRTEQQEADSLAVDSAIMELLEMTGYLHIRH